MATAQNMERSKRAWLAPSLAIAASFLLVSFLIVTVSRAAFSDTTDNSLSSVTAGTVTLTDDDSGLVLFNIGAMMPGDTSTNCIVVTYSGTVTNPASVEMYSGGYIDSGDLGTYLNVTIEEGTGGSFGSCGAFVLENTIEPTGTLASWDTTHTNYATGAGVWDPASTPESKTYRITLEFDAAAPNSEMGESVTALAFTWEVQS